jgi:hypothetical protein
MRAGKGLTLLTLALLSNVLVGACGSSSPEGGYNGPDTDGGSGGKGDGGPVLSFDAQLGTDALGATDSYIDPDAFFATDPPAMWCGPDGGASMQPVPGGTPQCPDDKNREGCPCPTAGATAACWPGLRANRGHGVCHDGMTTCTQGLESFNQVWGPCVGYTLPTPGATKGAPACKCFSAGKWAIANLSPCFADTGAGPGSGGASSSYQDATGNAQCASTTGTPTQPWSTDTLTVDCAGHYKLCYELKAGKASSPQPTDCSVGKVCVDADYPTANMAFPMPDLPGWAGTDTQCAVSFATTGGYGEMSVVGLSVLCDKVDDGSGNPYVFNRVQYCPLSCNTTPTGPGCQGCGQGGSGGF